MRVLMLLLLLYATNGGADMKAKLDMLHSVVLVSVANSGTGSGIVMLSDKETNSTVILTALHVVRKSNPGDLMVTFYPDKEEYPAELIKRSGMYDMALLRVNHYHPYEASHVYLSELNVFTPIMAIGAAMGKKPFPKEGIVERYTNSHMHTSAPIMFGDSGGGVFTEVEGKWCLVGMMIAVPLVNPHYPVAHMAINYNIFSIVEFMTTP